MIQEIHVMECPEIQPNTLIAVTKRNPTMLEQIRQSNGVPCLTSYGRASTQ